MTLNTSSTSGSSSSASHNNKHNDSEVDEDLETSTASQADVNSNEPTDHSSGKRLIIQKMVLKNFKSYAGKREIGPFDKSFTCVVGPNGSGKSNVIDAIQFVFGKKGKKLRLKKLSELIHSSKNYPNLEEASVSVHFAEIFVRNDNSNHEIVPDSEFIVKRTVNRNSVSTYYIDSGKSSYTEVTNLLKSKGIDLENNRFLILQGEVEQISLMKPKAPSENEDGLLEYIEDIIGTNKYVEKIEKSLVEVEQLNEKRQEKLNRVNGAKKEKEALEGPMNEAIKYLKKKRDLVEKYHLLAQKQLYDSSQRLTQKQDENTKLKAQHELEKEKLSQVSAEISKKEELYKNCKKEQDTISKKLQKQKSKFTEFENKDEKLKEDLKITKNRKQQLEKSLKSGDSKKDDLQHKIDECLSTEDSLKRELSKLTPDLEKATQKVDEIYQQCQKEISTLSQQKEEKNKQLAPFKQRENEIKEKISLAESEIKLVQEKKDSTKKEYERKKSELEKLNNQLTTKKEEITKNKKIQANNINRIKEERERLTSLENGMGDMEKQVIVLRQRYSTLKTDQQNSISQNRIVQALLNESNIADVYGRLGDLGTIDPKYDIAISMACGFLNSIVVETTDAATKCVDYLKEHSLGVATFIILEKISPPQTLPENSIPEKVPRLYDLITPNEEKFRKAFYYGVQNTLVANDLEQATRIAYNKQKRWRVVSLKGDLIEEYGTMSGGGKTIVKGLMTLSGNAKKIVRISEKEISEAKSNLEMAEHDYLQQQYKRQSISQELKRLEAENSNIEMRLKEISLDIESIEKTATDLQNQMKNMEKDLKKEPSKEYEDRLTDLNNELEEYKKELEDHRRKFKSLEADMEKLVLQIENVGDGKLKKQKDLVKELNNKIDEANLKLSKVQVQRESHEKSLKKLEKQLKSEQEEFDNIGKKIEDIEAKKKLIEEEAAPIMMEISELEVQLKEKETETTQKESECEQVRKQFAKAREKELELKNSLDDCIKEVKEIERLVTKRREEMEKHEKTYDSEFEVLFELESAEQQESGKKRVKKTSNGQEDEMDTSDDEKANDQEDDNVMQDEEDDMGKSFSVRLARKKKQAIQQVNIQTLNYDITILVSELEKMKPNLSAIEDYKKKEEDYKVKVKDLEQITIERNKAQKLYEELRRKRLDEFMRGFTSITMKLKEIYQTITLGGDAELELVDSLDPFSEGIVFSVRPPRKSWKNISNLSGGEKTLSSLALVFALHHYKPTPIYVMDEIDAALDFRNVSIVANYVKERTKNDAQFLIISLRNNMFELANTLVGIYKTSDVTKTVTINPSLLSVPKASTEQK
ncbi:hypothetical protein C9374_005888 [Naegleria lovaniensis]|uniref:Structural maintenance of chromosomes protein n=1 Tax=Naegleria lovaniensis TaxID=51637 RepID=A0AA88GJE5_NAELO|nr:uncharacterized protein C9374_005888 [Naegleria lovaniensis]KAG2382096.1 hypothetical protein C9374_005888 [Naegleria lovaniensis]